MKEKGRQKRGREGRLKKTPQNSVETFSPLSIMSTSYHDKLPGSFIRDDDHINLGSPLSLTISVHPLAFFSSAETLRRPKLVCLVPVSYSFQHALSILSNNQARSQLTYSVQFFLGIHSLIQDLHIPLALWPLLQEVGLGDVAVEGLTS